MPRFAREDPGVEDAYESGSDDGSTSSEDSEDEPGRPVIRLGRTPTHTYDDPANMNWRAKGLAACCTVECPRRR